MGISIGERHLRAILEIRRIQNIDAVAYKHHGSRKHASRYARYYIAVLAPRTKNPFISMSGMEQRFAEEAERCPLPKIVKRNKSILSFLFLLADNHASQNTCSNDTAIRGFS